jgi:hypothetical protein
MIWQKVTILMLFFPFCIVIMQCDWLKLNIYDLIITLTPQKALWFSRCSRSVLNTRLRLVFYTLLSYSPNFPHVHYYAINARDSFSISYIKFVHFMCTFIQCFVCYVSMILKTIISATSYPGSFHYAPRWRKDPGPGWSRVFQISREMEMLDTLAYYSRWV